MRASRRLRATAAISAAVAIIVMAWWWWDTRFSANGPSRMLLGAQLFIRVLAVGAAAGGWSVPMLVLFCLGFFPTGLYLLGSPSYLALAGVADLVYLGATVALLVGRARR